MDRQGEDLTDALQPTASPGALVRRGGIGESQTTMPVLWWHPQVRAYSLGAVVCFAASLVVPTIVLFFSKLIGSVLYVPAMIVATRVARSLLERGRRRSDALLLGSAKQPRSEAELAAMSDGELVRLSGIARALAGRSLPQHPGWLYLTKLTAETDTDEPVLEQAIDFQLVWGEGAAWIEVEGACFLHGMDEETLHQPVGVRDGDRVEIIGYKSRRIDGGVMERLPRDAPERATVRGGKTLPLLIVPEGEPSRLQPVST